MFAKEGSATSGNNDSPLKKSERRKLRDRALEILFSTDDDDSNNASEEWTSRAEKLINDAIIAPKGGDVMSRKLKLATGEHATLFLRTPSPTGEEPADKKCANDQSYNDILQSYPTTWPYHQTAQPILLEYEDADRKVHLVPLLPMLAALPPPLPSSPLTKVESSITDAHDKTKRYKIPNISVHPEVSKYICRGADLMSAGIRTFPSPWALRQSKGLVTISIIGNPQPAAIGFVDRTLFRGYCYPKNGGNNGEYDASVFVGSGTKGVGVSIVNCYGDDLWKLGLPKSAKQCEQVTLNPLAGGVYDNGDYGNVGFVDGKYVYRILQPVEEDESHNVDADEANNDDDNTCEETTNEMKEMNISDSNEGTVEQESANNNIDEEKEPEADPDHDDILVAAFFTSLLQILVNKTSLPIPVSTYYAKHLMDAVPADGPKLDLKQTSYKKIGPFLLDMASEGVIQLGASKDGKDKCATLSGIVKNHPDLIAFKKKWKAENGADSFMTTSQDTKLAVVDLFIVPRHIADIFQLEKDEVMATNAKTEERRGTGFLTKKECNAIIENYIDREELKDPKGKGKVLVNGPLCDAIYRASKKNKAPDEGQEYPTSVKRKDLIEKFFIKMEKGHALVEMPGSRIVKIGRGAPPLVDIEVENRQGNKRKFLTRIRGMEAYGIDGKSFSNDVSHRFACSASVETNPVGRPALKKNCVEIVFQGRLDVELTALLSGDEKMSTHGGAKNANYYLPKSVINVVLRKGIPAKKK
jgi:translation initiation factor 2D